MQRQMHHVFRQTGIGFDSNRYACAVLFGDSNLSVLQAQACQCVWIHTRGRHGGMDGCLQRCGTAHDGIGVIDAHSAHAHEAA